MTENNHQPPRERRVGTLTFGITLVACGLGMLAALFFPALEIRLLVRLSPLLLVLLGAEVLWACRRDSKIRYDWLGLLLCFLVICAALALFSLAWVFVNYPQFIMYW